MIQKKREIFKKQIRRKQLDAIFSQKRIHLLQPVNFEAFASQFTTRQNHIASQIIQILRNISQNCTQYSQKDIENSLGFIRNQLSVNCVEAELISKILKQIIQNHPQNQNQSWSKLSTFLQSKWINHFFQIFFLMEYRQLNHDCFFKLASAFWLIFSSGQIDIFHRQNHSIFDLVLKIFKKMLDSHSSIVFKVMKSMGLGLQLTRIIQFDSEYLNLQNEFDLIYSIDTYLRLQSQYQQINYINNINGSTILQIESSEKNVFLAFSLYLIDKKYQNTYYYALNTLASIFQKYLYLIDSLDIKYVKLICDIVRSLNKTLSLKAVQLIDEIVQYSEEKRTLLLKKCYLPNILYQTLLKEAKHPGETTRPYCIYVSNIISSLVFCKNIKEQKFIAHPIWQLAYQNMYIGSPLLSLVCIFQYYFLNFNRKAALTLLQNYLNNVSLLQLQQLQNPQKQIIKVTIRRSYIHCKQFWPQDYQDKFCNFIQQNKLQYLLEDLMEIQDENQLKSL